MWIDTLHQGWIEITWKELWWSHSQIEWRSDLEAVFESRLCPSKNFLLWFRQPQSGGNTTNCYILARMVSLNLTRTYLNVNSCCIRIELRSQKMNVLDYEKKRENAVAKKWSGSNFEARLCHSKFFLLWFGQPQSLYGIGVRAHYKLEQRNDIASKGILQYKFVRCIRVGLRSHKNEFWKKSRPLVRNSWSDLIALLMVVYVTAKLSFYGSRAA